jgi:hypothetical protein
MLNGKQKLSRKWELLFYWFVMFSEGELYGKITRNIPLSCRNVQSCKRCNRYRTKLLPLFPVFKKLPSNVTGDLIKPKAMFSKFKVSELLLFILVIALIFVSEYYYVVLKDPMRAIFIGLWPPTIIGILIFLNLKRK